MSRPWHYISDLFLSADDSFVGFASLADDEHLSLSGLEDTASGEVEVFLGSVGVVGDALYRSELADFEIESEGFGLFAYPGVAIFLSVYKTVEVEGIFADTGVGSELLSDHVDSALYVELPFDE